MVLNRICFMAWVALLCAPVWAEDHSHHMHHQHNAVKASSVSYVVPEVKLMREDGARVSLAEEMSDGKPVLMSFIYTDCTAVCPLISRTLAQFQQLLGDKRDEVRIVSVSIDPERDTVARLAEYARRYDAGPSWHHYTGSVRDSIAVQTAFNVFRGDKMNHTPVYLLRAKPGDVWLRLDGYAKSEELLAQYRELMNF